MEEWADSNREGNQIYQFEDMEVDIFQPAIKEVPEEGNQQQEDLNIQKQLQQLKETYIFRQKLEPSLVNAIRGKKGARRQKKLRTMQSYQSTKNLRKEKQNIDMLIEQRKNKEFSEKLFILHQLKAPLQCTIEVEKKGIFNWQPIYRIFDAKGSKFLLACQKESMISNRYVFSSNPKKVSSQEKSYFGQLTPLNLFNSRWMLYDQGFDPSKVREIDECRSQLLYAKFQHNCLGISDTSRIRAITPVSMKLINQYRPFEGSVNLLEEYSLLSPEKVSEYCYERSNIVEPFRKRLFDIPLSHGFVIIPEGSTTPLLYFGRRAQGKYVLEIHPPLSVLQAFALSILHLRLADA